MLLRMHAGLEGMLARWVAGIGVNLKIWRKASIGISWRGETRFSIAKQRRFSLAYMPECLSRQGLARQTFYFVNKRGR